MTCFGGENAADYNFNNRQMKRSQRCQILLMLNGATVQLFIKCQKWHKTTAIPQKNTLYLGSPSFRTPCVR